MIKLYIRFLGIWADLCDCVTWCNVCRLARTYIMTCKRYTLDFIYVIYVILIIIRRRSRVVHSVDNSYCVKEKVLKFWVPADIMLHHWAYRVEYIYTLRFSEIVRIFKFYCSWNETSFFVCVSLGCASDSH